MNQHRSMFSMTDAELEYDVRNSVVVYVSFITLGCDNSTNLILLIIESLKWLFNLDKKYRCSIDYPGGSLTPVDYFLFIIVDIVSLIFNFFKILFLYINLYSLIMKYKSFILNYSSWYQSQVSIMGPVGFGPTKLPL
jgi:hypothetical protein